MPVDRRVLIVAILAVVPAWLVTGVVSTRFTAHRRRLAADWTERGDRALAAHRISEAVKDFETAVVYDRLTVRTVERFGRALAADGRRDAATAELLSALAAQPADGMVNLDLARLAAAEHRLPSASHYYHAAIDGVWEAGSEQSRDAARRELAALQSQPETTP